MPVIPAACDSRGADAGWNERLVRSIAPSSLLPSRSTAPITEVDARKATAPARFEVKPPQGAPNVVIVLIDDIGFGHSSTFGGPINMPTLEKMASSGLRYNRFHTTALCSPTRTALLTGRNHHVNNAGAIMELATAFPGNTGVRPASVAPLAQILRMNGYSTAAFGKYHETAPWEVSVSGPYDRWPTGSGFDKFYGFIGGETNQWAPAVYDGVTRVEVPHDPNYHFTTDMTDQAINWTRFQQAMTPDKPFYVYFATGATHAPHHAPKEYAEKYRGKFDRGWDTLREETLARQIKLGVVPAGTKLTARPAEIPAWDSLTADQKRLFARQMETFAGFAEHTDHEVGRLVDALRDMGELDNTIFFYIVGDNGASAEGGPDGSYNEILALNGIVSDVSSQLSHIDEWGGPSTFPHFSIGWAHAGNTPFQWTKQVASHFGGTRNAMVVSWPARIKEGRRPAVAVPPRHRRRAHRARGRRDSRTDVGERDEAAADGWRVDDVQLCGREGCRAAHDAVLRDVRQPGHLPRGLGGGHASFDSLAHGAESALRAGQVGALQRERGLQRGHRSRRAESGQAEGTAGGVRQGSRPQSRLPAGRPPIRALRRAHCRPARSAWPTHEHDALARA